MERDEIDDETKDAERQTKALAGVAVVLFLAVVSLFLVQSLRKESEIEDCLMAQHFNCDALVDNR